MSQSGFPKKQTLRPSLVLGMCVKECPWEMSKDGREGSNSEQREKVKVMPTQGQPWSTPQGVLDVEWLFRVVLSWAEMLGLDIPTLISHCMRAALGRAVT